MTKTTSKKLGLKKENLRRLSDGALRTVNGGTFYYNYTVGCAAWTFTIESNVGFTTMAR